MHTVKRPVEETDTLSVKDVQVIMNIGQNMAYNLIHSGQFPVHIVGRKYRVPKEPFYAWLNQSSAADH